MSQESKNISSWSDYRSRRRWFFCVWFSGLPVVVLSSFLLNKVFHSSAPFYIISTAWMIFFAIVSVRFTLFRCPRCYRFFSSPDIPATILRSVVFIVTFQNGQRQTQVIICESEGTETCQSIVSHAPRGEGRAMFAPIRR